MHLIAVSILLTLAALQCVTPTAGAATVGLFAPDRYDGIPDMCLMPMDFGHCKAKVKRFYFDMRRMKCTTFYWGGCAGNINNFKSLEDCNKHCLDAFEDDGQNNDVAAAPASYNNNNSRSKLRGVNKTPSSNIVNNNINNYNSNINNNNNTSSNASHSVNSFKSYKFNKSVNTGGSSTTSSSNIGSTDYDE